MRWVGNAVFRSGTIITVNKIYQRAQDLKKFPKLGRIVPEIQNPNVRELIVGNYRLVYIIKKTKLIDILRVQYSAKLLVKKIFKGTH